MINMPLAGKKGRGTGFNRFFGNLGFFLNGY